MRNDLLRPVGMAQIMGGPLFFDGVGSSMGRLTS